MKFDNRNLHNNVVIIFKQLKTVQDVYFSYLEARGIGYLSFRISEDSELEKWPNYRSSRITPTYLMIDVTGNK